MTIRKKALLAIAITFVGLIVIMFAISRFILLDNLEEVEGRFLCEECKEEL